MNTFLATSLLSLLFFGYTSQISIVFPWYNYTLSPELLRLLLPFNFFIGMFLWNYYLAATTEPGRVLDGWHKAKYTNGAGTKDSERRLRYCYTCEKYKPPRTHHCAICDRCVLCMDHHCPWLGQCVGHFNHGYLIRTLFYANLTCTYHIAMISRRIYVNPIMLGDPEVLMVALNYANVIPFFSCILFFSYGQLSSLFRNRTSIEAWQERNLEKGVQAKYPYDLGVKRNIDSLLGPNPWLWWFPRPASGDGTTYPIVEGSEEPWPPITEDGSESKEGSIEAQQCFSFSSETQQTLRQRRAPQFSALSATEVLPD